MLFQVIKPRYLDNYNRPFLHPPVHKEKKRKERRKKEKEKRKKKSK